MKKEYIKPEMTIISVESISLLATSIPIGEDKENGVTGANKRGEWGDLWK